MNPTITPYATPTQPYTVAGTDTAYYDLRLILPDPAEFTVTVPLGAEVHAWSGTTPVPWIEPPATVALLSGGTWQAAASLGPWSIAVAAGPAADAPTVVTISSATSPGGLLRLRVRHIRATDAAGTATLHAGFNAETLRVLADPSIIGTPGPVAAPVVERTPQTLAGSPSATVQQDAAAATAEFGALPPARGSWERISGNLAFDLTPSGTANAEFLAPGVYEATDETFLFRAYYDLDGSSSFTADEPDNTAEIVVTIEPARHRMALVLDRSGSMWGTLPGGSESKWDASKRAAHIWLDLFSAFRAASDQSAGFLTFEASPCGYGSCVTVDQLPLLDPVSGDVATALTPLPSFASLNELKLGTPQTCTPIGDALKRAFEQLATPPLADHDVCTILLLTDGRENAGCVSIKSTLPSGTASVASVLNSMPALKAKLAIYPLGAGSNVDEDALNNLPALAGIGAAGGAYYRLAGELEELLESFGEMIGDSVDAENLDAAIDNSQPAAFFTTNSGERRLAVAVAWSNIADTLRLSHRAQGSSDPWTTLPLGPASGSQLRQRATHGMITVELPTALAGAGTARDWRVERLSGGIAQPLTAVLAMVDLHLKVSVAFDKSVYRTGESMHVSCTVMAGKDRVTGATVTVEVLGVDLGLGTMLVTQGGQAFGGVAVAQLPVDRFVDVSSARFVDGPSRAVPGTDTDTPKAALFDYLLRQNQLADLPRSIALFADGTDQLFDDGAHDDGSADDGHYANRFDRTEKEGTYTFRFRVEGVLPDGSHFRRVKTVSKWVGVGVDAASSPVTLAALADPPSGFLGQVIAVTPRDANGEFLGPFREQEVVIESSAGSFTAPVESRLDGSYVRTLLYERGTEPVVTVSVNEQPLPVAPPRESCWRLLVRAVRCTLRALLFWKRP